MPRTELQPSRSVSERVVTTVARREGVDPAALTTPLFDAVDPDALDSLFAADADVAGSVTFGYAGYRVTVDADGSVSLVSL